MFREDIKVIRYRCYHCNAVFSGEAAKEHFGDKEHAAPAMCQQAASDSRMLDAMIVELERYGIHRNHHNGASIKLLWEKAQAEQQSRVTCLERVLAEVEELVRAHDRQCNCPQIWDWKAGQYKHSKNCAAVTNWLAKQEIEARRAALKEVPDATVS